MGEGRVGEVGIWKEPKDDIWIGLWRKSSWLLEVEKGSSCSQWAGVKVPGGLGNCYYCPELRGSCCRSKWQPTPVLLPGEFHGQRSLADYSPGGHKESDMTECKGTWTRTVALGMKGRGDWCEWHLWVRVTENLQGVRSWQSRETFIF